MPRRCRLPAAIAATIGWLALALQLLLSIQLTGAAGNPAWQALWIYLGYFTILTNLLVASVLTAVAREATSGFGYRLRGPNVLGSTAMSIIVVSVVYNLVLRQLWHPEGWQLVADITLHDVMPVTFASFWWLAAPKPAWHRTNLARWLIWPTVYFTYALTRGAIDGWYPYPFLDVGAIGYARVLINACGLLLAFAAVAVALLLAGRWQAARDRAG